MAKVIYNMMAGKRRLVLDDDEPKIDEVDTEGYGTTVAAFAKPAASVARNQSPLMSTAANQEESIYTGKEDEFARGCSGPVFYGTSSGTYTCYGCDNRLSWVSPFKRKVCGVVQHVTGHFRHTASTNCTKGGETIYHNAAKHAAATANLKYKIPCCELSCNQLIPVHFEEDVVYEVECPFLNYKLDVGIKDKNGAIIGAIEIFQTHAIGKVKQDDLTDHNIAWIEVRSRKVLGAVERGHQTCTATRCAFNRCQSCEEKRRIQELNYEEQRIEAVAATERRAKSVLHISNDVYISLLKEERLRFWKACLDAAAEKLGEDAPDWTAEIACEVAKRAEADAECAKADAANIEAGSVVLPFGKYEGRPLASIMKTDESYVRWCAGWTGYKNKKPGCNRPEARENPYAAGEVREEARRLLKGRCLLCFCNTGQDWKNWCAVCYRDA